MIIGHSGKDVILIIGSTLTSRSGYTYGRTVVGIGCQTIQRVGSRDGNYVSIGVSIMRRIKD
jgi:hypothetical protein